MFRINSKRYLVYVYNALSGDCNGKYTKILRHSEIIAPITAVRRIRADIFGRSAPDQEESGQSQFAPLKLRSLALVPSSGALSRPYELHLWQLHCETLPAAPRRSGQRLAAVPRRASRIKGIRSRDCARQAGHRLLLASAPPAPHRGENIARETASRRERKCLESAKLT